MIGGMDPVEQLVQMAPEHTGGTAEIAVVRERQRRAGRIALLGAAIHLAAHDLEQQRIDHTVLLGVAGGHLGQLRHAAVDQLGRIADLTGDQRPDDRCARPERREAAEPEPAIDQV